MANKQPSSSKQLKTQTAAFSYLNLWMLSAGAHLRGRRGLQQAQLYKQMPIYAIVTEKKKFWGNTSAPFYLSPPHSVPHEPGQPSYYTSISEARGPHGPRKSITPKRRQIPTCRWLTGSSFLKEPGDFKKKWWFDCTLRPTTGTFTTLSKITAVSERYLFLPNFSHFSFAPVLTKPSFSYTKMTEVISHAQLLVYLHGPAAMKVSGL